VDDLCRTPSGERAEKLVAALVAANDGGWLGIDDAAGTIVATLLVAAARNPVPLQDDGPIAFYPASLVPHFAAQFGPSRNGLGMLEIDEAGLHFGATYPRPYPTIRSR
jgi:hypothetical protein